LKGKELRKLHAHLKREHGMDSYGYVKKHFYNGKHPLCACGCGNEVGFKKFKFLKYYKDHKNFVKWTNEQKENYKEKFSDKTKYGEGNQQLTLNLQKPTKSYKNKH